MKTFERTYTSKYELDDEKLYQIAKENIQNWYKEEIKKDNKCCWDRTDLSLDSFVSYLIYNWDTDSFGDWIEDDYLTNCIADDCWDEDLAEEIRNYETEIVKPIYDNFIKDKR